MSEKAASTANASAPGTGASGASVTNASAPGAGAGNAAASGAAGLASATGAQAPVAKTAAAGESHVLRGIVFAALGGVCWGFSGNCAQMLTAELGVPVLWITAVRLTVAAVIFLVICLVREPRHLLAALRDGRVVFRSVVR